MRFGSLTHGARGGARLITLGLLAVMLAGCSRAHYRRQADREVYGLIDSGSTDPRWPLEDFTIQPDARSRFFDPDPADCPPMPPDDPTSHRLMHCVDGKQGWPYEEHYGRTSQVESPSWQQYLPRDDEGSVVLDRQTAVQLALLHSREYQRALESLYLSALDVSLERFRFDTQFFGGNSTFFTVDGPLSGRAGASSALSTDSPIEVRRLFATGSQLVVEVANSVVWQFAGSDGYSALTPLSFSLVQPLLRGAGRAVILEQLTDAERALLANIRQMERFRRGFYLQVITGRSPGSAPSTGGVGLGDVSPGGRGGVGAYLSLLEEQLRIRNQRTNVAALRGSLDRLDAYLEAGLTNPVNVDQLRQSLYNSQLALVLRSTNYQDQLDGYKITLGLPPQLDVEIQDPYVRPFDLIDPALTATQNEVSEVLQPIGELVATVVNADEADQSATVASQAVQTAEAAVEAGQAAVESLKAAGAGDYAAAADSARRAGALAEAARAAAEAAGAVARAKGAQAVVEAATECVEAVEGAAKAVEAAEGAAKAVEAAEGAAKAVEAAEGAAKAVEAAEGAAKAVEAAEGAAKAVEAAEGAAEATKPTDATLQALHAEAVAAAAKTISRASEAVARATGETASAATQAAGKGAQAADVGRATQAAEAATEFARAVLEIVEDVQFGYYDDAKRAEAEEAAGAAALAASIQALAVKAGEPRELTDTIESAVEAGQRAIEAARAAGRSAQAGRAVRAAAKAVKAAQAGDYEGAADAAGQAAAAAEAVRADAEDTGAVEVAKPAKAVAEAAAKAAEAARVAAEVGQSGQTKPEALQAAQTEVVGAAAQAATQGIQMVAQAASEAAQAATRATKAAQAAAQHAAGAAEAAKAEVLPDQAPQALQAAVRRLGPVDPDRESILDRARGFLAPVEDDCREIGESREKRHGQLQELSTRPEFRRGDVDPGVCDVAALDRRIVELNVNFYGKQDPNVQQLANDLLTTQAEARWFRNLPDVSGVNHDLPATLADLKQFADDAAQAVQDTGEDLGAWRKLFGRFRELLDRLSAHLLELSLIQARARLDTTTLTPVELDPDEALEIARVNRRDWMNGRAALVDQWRQIEVIAKELESDLDLTFSGDLSTRSNTLAAIHNTTGRLQVGFQFDAPLTRLAERNVYRRALISYQQARRQYYALEDRISQVLRETLRSIHLAPLQFELQRAAVHLAITRTETQHYLLRMGRLPGQTAARDVVDAFGSLLNAQNALLRLWLEYESSRMSLDLDLGTMELDERGTWIDPGPIRGGRWERLDQPELILPGPERLPVPEFLPPFGGQELREPGAIQNPPNRDNADPSVRRVAYQDEAA